MSVIVNATPLISLALIDRLELLPRLFGDVIAPSAVHAEVVGRGRGRPGAQRVASVGWLQIRSPESSPQIEPLLLGLDPGEVEVLLLGLEMRPAWVLIDERLARRVARLLGLPVKGTLGVLLAAYAAGFLNRQSALAAAHQLIDAGIFLSPRLMQRFEDELSDEKES